jgi:hypothetical protein
MMTGAEEKMVQAYSQQEEIYSDILGLVQKQKELLNEQSVSETARIVYLCKEVEAHLEKIENIESQIATEKRECLSGDAEISSTLKEVLGRIADKIGDTRRIQKEVQMKLAKRVGYMADGAAEDAKPAKARRAQKMYNAT